MDPGIRAATAYPIQNPLPPSWLGRLDAPPTPPAWANFKKLTAAQIQNLQSQIAYDQSGWDYKKIGDQNQLGRYQFGTQLLEDYGLLAPGVNAAYGVDCVNYIHSWTPIYFNNGINAYQNYFYNSTSLNEFLNNSIAQEHLAYQRLVDLYITGLDAGIILETDDTDVTAGMITVAWVLGVGTAGTATNIQGTGAWAWRYYNIGNGASAYSSGRYAIDVLS
jgi:hypothetical protein